MLTEKSEYVPVLKWRQGEYQALLRLHDNVKLKVVPLIELTPPDFDFELWQPQKTIDEHLEKFAARLKQKWGERYAFLDAGLIEPADRMIGGVHPLTWIGNEVRAENSNIIPVTALDRDAHYQAAVRQLNLIDQNGAAIRCSLEDAADPDFDLNIESCLEAINAGIDSVDIVIDLGSPNFEPIDVLAQALASVLLNNSTCTHARSLTLIATAFPSSMAEVKQPVQIFSRKEWILYRQLITALPDEFRQVNFGDYAIAAPEIPQGDMRLLKPSATVRYTVDDGWVIVKGKNVRDNGFSQYTNCCAAVANANGFLGPSFSAGSKYIEDCRNGAVSTGNLATWRWVGTNHHITKVIHDLANFYGP